MKVEYLGRLSAFVWSFDGVELGGLILDFKRACEATGPGRMLSFWFIGFEFARFWFKR